MNFNMSTSIICFWLRANINIDGRFVHTVAPNTILGIIPMGKQEQSIPLNSVSNVKTSFSVRLIPLLLGLFLIMGCLGGIGSISAADIMYYVLLFVIGALLLLSGLTVTLSIERSGPVTKFKIPFYDKKKADSAAMAIRNAMANEVDKTDLNQFFDKKPI